MPDPSGLSDEEILDELASTDDPDEVIALRLAAAQRGLHQAAASIPLAQKREIHELGGGKL